jgi:FtsZ-binding cell division protein ZapB
MNGKAFELLELPPLDDDEEYHTPMVSRRGSIFTLPGSLQGSQDSYRGSPDVRHGNDDQMLRDEQQPDVGSTVDFAHPNSSTTWDEQLYPARRYVPGDQNQTNDPSMGTRQNSAIATSSSSFGDLGRYFSNHEKVVLDLQSANATLTERVGQLETSRNSWQDAQARLVALESRSTPHQQGTQQGLCPVTTRALERRILKLENANTGMGDVNVEEEIKRLEKMMEGERRERRAVVDNLQKKIQSLTHEVAVLQSEDEGLRERLNKLTGQVSSLRR